MKTFVFVFMLVAVAACGSGNTPAPASDAGRDSAVANPDMCLVLRGEAPRPAGQMCKCAADCMSGNCEQGICCSGNLCGARRSEGAPCTSGEQCQTRLCVDGVCCDNACQGPCTACNVPGSLGTCSPVAEGAQDPKKTCKKDPVESCGFNGVCNGEGACARYSDETVCRAGSCLTATQAQAQSTCNGMGACVAEMPENCAPAICEAGKCLEKCTTDAQCEAGKACVNGSCGAFPLGRSCSANNQCDSELCVDGFCCDDACVAPCYSCANAATRGTCSPVAAGAADPACATTAASTCGTNGKCDGMGECARHDAMTTCRPATCDVSANAATAPVMCMDGVCAEAPTPQSCAPFTCGANNRCRTSCADDAHCVAGSVCSNGACVGAPPPPPPEDAAPAVDAPGDGGA